MVILLKGHWYFSMNPGEDCESDVIATFENRGSMNYYIRQKGIELGKTTKTYEDEDDSNHLNPGHIT